MKRYLFVIFSVIFLIGLIASPGASAVMVSEDVQTEPLIPVQTLLSVYLTDEGTLRGTAWGILVSERFVPLAEKHIYLGGKVMDDEVVYEWVDAMDDYGNVEGIPVTSDYLLKGQTLNIYSEEGYIGQAVVDELDFWYEQSSGEWNLYADLVPVGEILFPESDIYALSGERVEMKRYTPSITETKDKVTFVIDDEDVWIADKFVWEKNVNLNDSEYFHPITVMSYEEIVDTISFFYENDYTNPLMPEFWDFNGDSQPEVILSGEGHNSYQSVYQCVGNRYVDTGLGWYSGD